MKQISLYISTLQETMNSLSIESIAKVVDILQEARVSGRQVFIMGNGGSASTASHFVCDLAKNTRRDDLPHFPVIGLTDMDADVTKLKHQCDFNFAAMSFSAEELAHEIAQHIPEFICEYKPDFGHAIADSWPRSIDDSAARKEWGWKPKYNLSDMTEDMLQKLGKRYEEGNLLAS